MNEDTPLRPLSLEAFEPRQSIWELIQGQAIEEERSDIKKLIGSSLIEETVDLHKEVIAYYSTLTYTLPIVPCQSIFLAHFYL